MTNEDNTENLDKYIRDLERKNGNLEKELEKEQNQKIIVIKEKKKLEKEVKRCDGTPNRSRAAGHAVPSLNNSVFIRNLKVSPIA